MGSINPTGFRPFGLVLKPDFFRGFYVEIHGVLLGGFSMSGSMRASAKSKMKKQSAWQRRRAMNNIHLVDG